METELKELLARIQYFLYGIGEKKIDGIYALSSTEYDLTKKFINEIDNHLKQVGVFYYQRNI